MEHSQISDHITRVTKAELRADLTTFLDCVAFSWKSSEGRGGECFSELAEHVIAKC